MIGIIPEYAKTNIKRLSSNKRHKHFSRKDIFSVKRTFIFSRQPQFRANLHSHSTLSDGTLSPQQLKEAYRSQGYSILAITDHEYPCDHSELSEADFLLLTAYEAHIRATPRFNVYTPEIHLNLFAKKPHNETIVCYRPEFADFMTTDRLSLLSRVGSECPLFSCGYCR